MISDETFFAWLDGELEDAEAGRVAAAVAADPELARRADQHRALKARLARAFDPIAQAPLPGHIAPVAGARVIDLGQAREKRRWAPLPQWAAIAATLVVGVLTGTMIPRDGTAPVAAEGGRLYAAAALDRALDRQLASAPSGEVRVALTFRDGRGALCRSFTTPAASGLACRDGGRWQLRGLFAAPEGQATDYRMAAGTDPNLAALIDSAMAGEPLDAAQEKAARERGWR